MSIADAAEAKQAHRRAMLDEQRTEPQEQQLTERELAAAVLLAYGHTNRDVATHLNVSIRTAEAERARLMRKLGFRRRAELVRWALERGLLR